jgi:YidC/Oxa1 family membrane protein insertase
MRKARNIILLVLFGVALMLGWPRLMDLIWPPQPKSESALVKFGTQTASEGAAIRLPDLNAEAVIEIGDAVVSTSRMLRRKAYDLVADVMRRFPLLGMVPVEPKKPPEPQVKAPEAPAELIALGHGPNPYYLKVLLNTHGGSIQQVILTAFNEADREGREVRVNGTPKNLQLVPGLTRPRASSLHGQREINEKEPELFPGKVNAQNYEALGYPLAYPSYVMFHYESPDDERPIDMLGSREWKVIAVSNDNNADEQFVVFQTELSDPYNLIITKTFTLKRKEYHVGMQVDVARSPNKTGINKFRYQIQGAHDLPIEGEWYTSIFHQIIVGFADDKGKSSRYIEDAARIREWEGSDRQNRPEKAAIRYAATTVQYFASVIAVDDQQDNRRFIEYVRATPWGKPPPAKSGHEFLNDATVRTITEEFDPGIGVSHKYLLYQGPIKVRLLKQLSKGKEVNDALVDRYLDKINLGTMTDGHMPNWFGRRASDFYWTDLVVAFTNLVHSLLYYLHQDVLNLGICIVLLTIIVRGLLFPLSRRQAHNAQVMQAKMAKLQPELRKLQEKFKDDFHRMNQERMKLYKEHGVNPFAALGGCFMLLLQMPVFMGLYYALQESVFFRLYDFLWIPNLAAPDMLIRWGESIPFISTPEDIGAMLYLGPFFNVLPIIAVVLMLFQQKMMMPPSDDPQVQAQQRMMKFMMILFGLFFYKVAAGLCIYFIASSLWGLTERKLMPKAKPSDEGAAEGPSPTARKEKNEPPKTLGWWGRKKARWKEKWKKVLEEAQKQAEYRREQNQQQSPGSTPSAPPNRGGGGGKKKRKKK